MTNVETNRKNDKFFMTEAIKLAKSAHLNGETPVGAVIVKSGEIIGRGANSRETDGSPLSHAELIAMAEACAFLDDWRLNGCTMYVTLEPCPMCAGAIVMARLSRLVFGAYSADGAIITRTRITDAYSPSMLITGGMMKDECSAALERHFEELRK